MENNKKKKFTKIIIYGYDVVTTEEATKQVTEQLKNLKISFNGPSPLPTKSKLVTVLISPHKHKDSQEQFVRKIHRRIISLGGLINSNTISSLAKLSIPDTAKLSLKTPF